MKHVGTSLTIDLVEQLLMLHFPQLTSLVPRPQCCLGTRLTTYWSHSQTTVLSGNETNNLLVSFPDHSVVWERD